MVKNAKVSIEVLIEEIDTKITDHWGVEWNETETVRDFLQNFYDSNKVKDIKIEVNGSTVSISAPSDFDYKELIYFGSDKGLDGNSIGKYGEGFKVSLLNAMKNYGCDVEMHVADNKLEPKSCNREILP